MTRRLTAAAWALIHGPQRLMVGVVKAYRLLLKPWLGNACRFEPTCSQYALTALETHGALVGGTLAAGRLLRCHPWCDGGCDEVPAQAPPIFTRLGLAGRPVPHHPKPAVQANDLSHLSVQEPAP